MWNPNDGTAQGAIGAHRAGIRGIAYSADGAKIATIGDDATLKVWQQPLQPAAPLNGNGDRVASVAFTANGELGVTGGADKSVRVFNAANGQQVRALPEVPEAVTSVALGREDGLVAAATTNGLIKIWTMADGAPWKGDQPVAGGLAAPSILAGHDGSIASLQFSADGKHLLSGGADGTLRWWQLPQAPSLFQDNSGPISRFVVDAAGKLAASIGVVDGKPAILIRDLAQDGKLIGRLIGHEAAVNAIAFDSRGRHLVSGDAANTVRVWNLADPKFPELAQIAAAGPVTAVALNTTATQVFAATSDHVIGCWQLSDATELRKFTGHGGAVRSLLVDGNVLYSASADGTVRAWNADSGAAIRTINHGAPVTGLAIAPQGKTIASVGTDKNVKIWQGSNGAALASLAGHTADPIDIRFNADATRLVSLANDGVVLWDVAKSRRLESIASSQVEWRGIGFVGDTLVAGVADGAIHRFQPSLLHIVDGHPGGVTSAVIVANNTRVAAAGVDKSIKLWNLADGKLAATFTGSTSDKSRLAVTADGKTIYAVDASNRVFTWVVPPAPMASVAPAQIWELPVPIVRLALNTDGTRLALGGEDHQIRVWDTKLGIELERHAGHTGAITAVDMSADGQRVLSGSDDRSGRVTQLSVMHALTLPKAARDIAFLTGGTQLAVAGGSDRLAVWTLGENGLTPSDPIPAGNPPAGFTAAEQVSLSVTPDGSQLAVLDLAGRAHVWSVAEKTLLTSLPGQNEQLPANGPAGRVVFSPDATKFLIARGQQIRIHDASNGRMLERFDEPAGVLEAAIGNEGRALVVARAGEKDNLAIEPISLERLWEAHDGPIKSLTLAPDGNTLASCGDDGLVHLWSMSDGQRVRTYAREDLPEGAKTPIGLLTVAFTRNNAQLLATGADATLRVWPVQPPANAEGQPADPETHVLPLATHLVAEGSRCLSVSFDNLKVAVGSKDGIVRVLELSSGRELERFVEGNAVEGVAFASDNRTVVSGNSSGEGHVHTLSILVNVTVPDATLHDIAVMAGGAQVVTASTQGLQQWSLASGELQRTFELPKPISTTDADNEATNPAPEAQTSATEFVTVSGRADNAQVAGG